MFWLFFYSHCQKTDDYKIGHTILFFQWYGTEVEENQRSIKNRNLYTVSKTLYEFLSQNLSLLLNILCVFLIINK